MKKGTYRKLIESLVAEKDLTEETVNIYNLACECDRLRAKIAEDSRQFARKMATYSEEVVEGRIYGTTPFSSSACRDIEQESAAYYALRPILSNLLHAKFGRTLATLLDEFTAVSAEGAAS